MVMSMMAGGVSSLAGDEEAWAGTKFSIATLNDLMDPVLALVRTLDMLRMGLFAVLLVITMVGLLNSFRMVLIERTQEIGTLRALGMQRGGIRGTFLFEALFLALAGSACGLAASLLGMGILGRVPLAADGLLQFFARSGRLSFPFVPADVAATVITLAAVTVLSAWLPARKASRLEPAAALRAAY